MTAVRHDSGILAGDERMLIDGELRCTRSGAKFDVIHPGTGEVAGQATDGTVEDMGRAVGAARRAFDTTSWSRDAELRYRCLAQLHAALTRDKERLRRIIVTEVGCPVGVVGAITPWNAPFYLNIAETIPPLMAGNTVVLKPAQLTPWAGTELGRIVAEETDIPAGVFNVVVSNANEVGAALSADPRVDMITFTGSTATGRAVLAAAAPTVKRTLLELGGKSAHIVLDDADFTKCLPTAAMLACIMSGQSCTLPSRILLPRSRYAEGLQILKAAMEAFPVGDPWDPRNMQGPQISEAQRQKVLRLIQAGVDSGATLITGGGIPRQCAKGYYVQATLLADVDPDSQVAQEEIFGPVLCVTPYDTDDEAVGLANNSIYGLSGEVSSADTERAKSVAMRMRTGTVTINGGSFFGPTSPFGGTKQSGLGYRNGQHGFKEYLQLKTMGLPA
jgi:aldehyde dehydrogenase (NAD+)